MDKISFDDFTEALHKVTASMDDDDKLEFYEELLDTGSASVSTRTIEHNFSIHDGFIYELIDLKEQKKNAEEMLKAQASVLAFGLSLSDDDLKEIDEIVNDDVDDDPIDLSVLQKEADESSDEPKELSEQEIMEIGYNPWTNEKVDFASLLRTVDNFIDLAKNNIEEYSEKIGFTSFVELQKERMVHFNFMKTIIKFYYDNTKLQASDGE